jgi:hypothetical protein
MSIGAAIVSRWDAVGLNSTIANLYRGAPDPSDPFSTYSRPGQKYGSTPLDDADESLPRAEFIIGAADRIIDSTSSKIYQADIVFKVWHSDLTALETLIDTAEDLLDNSNRAATSPMSLTGGFIVLMKHLGSESWVIDDNLCTGIMRFDLTWQKPATIPG